MPPDASALSLEEWCENARSLARALTADPTTGVPQAIASIGAMPKGS